MLNSPASNPNQTEFLSAAELRTAFEAFSAADSLRLEKAGQYLGRKCRTDGNELLGEAVLRALNGNRRCPRHLSALHFLIGVMKSLASEIIEKRNRDPLAKRIDNDPRLPSSILACFPADQPNPEQALMVSEEDEFMKAVVADIEALFANDKEAQQVLAGVMNGTPAEQVRKRCSMDLSTYNSARRRIRRRIDKKFPSGWNR
jgi:RNA polymerase sigma-70 factor (ECF subfamily)